MDELLVHEKLESLRRCVRRVEHKTPSSVEVLTRDLDLQDIIVFNLQRAVQVSVDVAAHVVADLELQAPRTMAETFLALRDRGVISPAASKAMVAAAGFRNVAVHAYTSIDWLIVYRICTEHMDDFRLYAREIDAWLSGRGPEGPDMRS